MPIFKNSNTFKTREMASTCLKQGLSYSEYQIYATEAALRDKTSDTVSPLVIPVLTDKQYKRLNI